MSMQTSGKQVTTTSDFGMECDIFLVIDDEGRVDFHAMEVGENGEYVGVHAVHIHPQTCQLLWQSGEVVNCNPVL